MIPTVNKHLKHEFFDYSDNQQEKFRHCQCVIKISCKRCNFVWEDRIYKHGLYGCVKCDGSYEHFMAKTRKRNKEIIAMYSRKQNKCKPVLPNKFKSNNIDNLVSSFSLLKIRKPSLDEFFNQMVLE